MNGERGMDVLVVGSGAREHALGWKLASSPGVAKVLFASGNAGTSRVGENLAVKPTDVDGIVATARDRGVGLVVVGPEAPLAAGLVDALQEASIPAFGPTRAAARLEASKGFAKDFMKSHGVPTAAYEVFEDAEAAVRWVRERGRPMVVKADGLAAGKGVVVASTVDGTVAALESIMVERAHGEAGARVVVEERLEGPEVSYHVVSDGERYVALAAAQDHKRLRDGDEGPNTGGMGAYSPPPMVTPAVERAIRERVVEPTLRGMREAGTPLRGALFVGLMVVDGAPKVLEYNVRFGDPETEVLMARWDGDVLPLLLGSARGDLGGVEPRWGAPAAMCVVLASEGYPGAYAKGRVIEGLDAVPEGVTVFHAGTARDGERVVTSGGRVLCVTATGDDVPAAAARAYAGVDAIRFEGAQHRRDIGWQAR
ncbi:MAG TPA: phosphoribosylamine--glycine ligase [Sandaracinaceae bacterium LLY-WYZ-13_1]|nr:phosphoribosylamine--glycine ligase [Sandaracinaceae bacterium LLY-WYZ-13_1]